MSDFMTILQKRRSIRRYEEKDVSEDSLNIILESVKWAPSWANTQCWEVIVVRDQSVREELQKAIFPKNPATKAIVSAPVLLALCGKLQSSGFYDGKAVTKFGDWFMFDLGIVAQTICLTAQAIGLGTVMVGLFDHNQAKVWRRIAPYVLHVRALRTTTDYYLSAEYVGNLCIEWRDGKGLPDEEIAPNTP